MPNSVISSSTLSDGYATANEEEEDLEEMAPSTRRSVRFVSAVSHEPVDLPASFHRDKDDDSSCNEDIDDSNMDSLAQSLRRNRARRPRLGHNCAANCFRKCPRIYACTLGVLVPLWILVGLCMLFGGFLGQLEAPGEMDSNDAAMRYRARARQQIAATKNVMGHLPQTCYLMSKNSTGSSVENITNAFHQVLAENGNLTKFVDSHRDELDGRVDLNLTFLRDFLDTCGEVAIAFMDDFSTKYWAGNTTDEEKEGDEQVDLNLYFNWNRCVNRTSPKEFNWIFIPTTQDVEDAQPQTQKEFYRDTWYLQRLQLYETYMQEYLAANESIWSARTYAFSQSVEKATARQVCSVNVAAAAWFWFTVMTTVGYGNQAPESLGGRLMVLTLGFLSILLFGTILAVSGTITSHVVKDFVHRMRCKCITRKGVMVFVWGFLAYAWMFFLAMYYKAWNWVRLSEDIDYFDAYWFAFISSTTVGLGDFYITPEVMFINDLLAFSLSFLFAFVLLSTFLSELGQVVGEIVPDLSEELRHRLKYVGVAKHFLGGKLASEPELTEQQQQPNSSEKEGQHANSNGNSDDG